MPNMKLCGIACGVLICFAANFPPKEELHEDALSHAFVQLMFKMPQVNLDMHVCK